MAALDQIGDVSKIEIQSVDSAQTNYNTNIIEQLNSNSVGLFINPYATYQTVDTAARALINLSTNTYNNSILYTQIDLAEQMAD